LNKHYYGSRSCKSHPHDDLGIKYFSSSHDKDFIKDQKEHPEHYRYKIVRIYETRKDALELEIKLHETFDVGINESFYNRSKQTSSKFNIYGLKHSEETRKKISESLKGKTSSEESRKKMSEARKGEKNHMYGKKLSEEHRKKIGAIHKGKKLSEDTLKKMIESRKGEKHYLFGKKHTKETLTKMSEAKKGENNPRFKGYYITPFGTFASSKDKQIKENNISDNSIIIWCKNNTKTISKASYAFSKYLQENFNESIIGKTFADIGFSFEPA
jgi:hypothetical protein